MSADEIRALAFGLVIGLGLGVVLMVAVAQRLDAPEPPAVGAGRTEGHRLTFAADPDDPGPLNVRGAATIELRPSAPADPLSEPYGPKTMTLELRPVGGESR